MRKSYLAMAMMGIMMSEMSYSQENRGRKYIPETKEPKKKIIPNGCKEYHFTRSGHYDTTENKWNDYDYIFTCVATSEKNAVKKYNAFIKNEKSPK